MKNYLWISLGWLAVALGVIGIFLPLLPTTPFLLLAAFAFSQGSERLHDWLMSHPRLGPPIHAWQENGVISRSTKIAALASMVIVFVLAWLFGAPFWALLTQAAVLMAVGVFIVTRPDGS